MHQIGLRQLLVVCVAIGAALVVGAICCGLAIAAHLISPPTLNLHVGSVTLVSFLLPSACPGAPLCPVANQAHENYIYVIWLSIKSTTTIAPHGVEVLRVPLTAP
jgi:hypothetical protein